MAGSKRIFLQAAVVSILLYGCTSRKLSKHVEKKIDGNYSRMLEAILIKSCSSSTATYNSPRKLSKFDEPDILDTAGEVRATQKHYTPADTFT